MELMTDLNLDGGENRLSPSALSVAHSLGDVRPQPRPISLTRRPSLPYSTSSASYAFSYIPRSVSR